MIKLIWLKKRYAAIESLSDRVKNEMNLFNDNRYEYQASFHKAISELEAAKDFLLQEIKREEWIPNVTVRSVKIITEEQRQPQYNARLYIVGNGKELGLEYKPFPEIRKEASDFAKTVIGVSFGDFTILGVSSKVRKRWVAKCNCGAFEFLKAKEIDKLHRCCHG